MMEHYKEKIYGMDNTNKNADRGSKVILITRVLIAIGTLIIAYATMGLWKDPSDPIKTKETKIYNVVSNDSIQMVQSYEKDRSIPESVELEIKHTKESRDFNPSKKNSNFNPKKILIQEGDCVVNTGKKSYVNCGNVNGDVNITY